MSLEEIACAICGNRETELVYKKFGLFIAHCTRCGLVFANPRLPREDIWKRYSLDYFRQEYLPALGVQDGRFNLDSFYARHARMLNLIADSIPPPGKLLEIGTGAGFFLKAAEHAGWDATVIEVSEPAVQFARNELGLKVKQEAAEEPSFPTGFFDVVVMFEVIEHVLNPARVLASVRRVLRQQGLLVLSTPNLEALSRLLLGNDWAVLSPAEHFYYFTATTLSKILTQTGFREVRFIRPYAGFGVFETVNPRYTHAPSSLRAWICSGLVAIAGPFLYRRIQTCGKGDTLLCFARVE